MKKLYTQLMGIAGLSIVAVGVCNAQTATLALKAPAKEITIDGLSADWGDSLSYYNPERKIHYSISNDKNNLYLVVKTKDPVFENDIMTSGLTFTIDPKGKKKNAFNTTYPSPAGAPSNIKPDETLGQKKVRANFIKFKQININGFKDINEYDLPATNNYDIKVAINYDEDGGLVYEESIPLQLFHAGDLAKGEWSFNIRLNGVDGSATGSSAPQQVATDPTMSGGRVTRVATAVKGSSGVMGSNRAAMDPNAPTMGYVKSTPPVDFWGKFTLAQ